MRERIFWSARSLLGALLETVTASGDGDDFRVVEQSVEDGASGRDIAEKLSPFIDWAV